MSEDFFAALSKALAGNPGRVRVPGQLALGRGVPRRRKRLGRLALYAKDLGVNDVHAGGELKISPAQQRHRRRMAALAGLKIQKANSNHDERGRFASAGGGGGGGDNAGTRAISGLDRAHALGGAAGSVVGAAAGEGLFGAAGSVVPGVGTGAGLLAGSFLGSAAGDYLGRKIAEQVYRTYNPDAAATPKSPVARGASAAASHVGGIAGAAAAENAASHFLSNTVGSKAKLAGQIVGSAWGEIAGTRFGQYLASRIGSSVGETRGNLLARFQKGTPFPFVQRDDTGDRNLVRQAAPTSRFRDLLNRADTAQRIGAAHMAMRSGRFASMQPLPGEPYTAFRARIRRALREETAQAPLTKAGKVSKASVDYSRGHLDGDHCGVCRHYQGAPRGSGPCEVVQGTVRYPMWCERFEEKP